MGIGPFLFLPGGPFGRKTRDRDAIIVVIMSGGVFSLVTEMLLFLVAPDSLVDWFFSDSWWSFIIPFSFMLGSWICGSAIFYQLVKNKW